MRTLLLPLFLLPLLCQAQVTAIKAGKLIDPETGKFTANQVIVVENGNVKSVGSEVPSGATVIDLSKSSVMPGMFDCHTHMCYRIDRREFASNGLFMYDLSRTTADRALDGVVNCREVLEAGFTTIRDVGNNGNYGDVALRKALEKGNFPGPTIITAGRIIAPFAGQYFVHPERPELREPEYFEADTRDEMVKAIRQNIHFGAQVIKIVVDDQNYIYSADDIKFIVEEAGKAGRKVCAHTLTERGALNAALGGVASIEHGFTMSDPVLTLCKEKGVVLVSTDLTPRVWKEYSLPDEVGQNIYNGLIDRLKRARKIGTTIAFGSDLVYIIPEMNRGQWALSQLDGFVKAGYTNPEILQMLVPNAAKLCGVDRRRGWIKAGQAADIIAMDANPLNDINAVKAVKFVMKEGRVVKNDYR